MLYSCNTVNQLLYKSRTLLILLYFEYLPVVLTIVVWTLLLNETWFQKYMQHMLSSVYSKFRNMDDKVNGFEDIHFKNIVTAEACSHQVKNCTQQALDLFRKWMQIIHPDNNNT